MDSRLEKVLMDVEVLNRDGKRNSFYKVPASIMLKVQVAVAEGTGFVLSDNDNLIAYSPGSVLRVGMKESRESKEEK